MQVHRILHYLETNAVMLLFAVAVVILIYTAGRFLKLPEAVAIALALMPFGLAWAYSAGMLNGILT